MTGLVVMAVVLLGTHYKQLLLRSEVTVKVVENALPIRCYTQDSLWRIGTYRDARPAREGFGYCGVVMTDHGAFRVVENGDFVPGGMTRASIVESLRPGCTHEIEVYGTAPPPRRGDPSSNQPKLTIFATSPPLRC